MEDAGGGGGTTGPCSSSTIDGWVVTMEGRLSLCGGVWKGGGRVSICVVWCASFFSDAGAFVVWCP